MDKISKIDGAARDSNDHARLRQNRERHLGFDVGQYIQPPPMVFTRDGHAMYMADMYRGHSAFLIGGGPSFTKVDSNKLKNPGFITMGINNSLKSFRTNLWVSVDSPTNFMMSIWLDPKIMKFVPFCHAEKKLFNNETWEMTNICVGDCPNVWFYRRNEHFNAKQFLFEDTFNWGNHKSFGGGRSVMLVAIRMLFYLGIRRIFLLGVDFKMDANYTYHFDQSRAAGSISNNNYTYNKMIHWFTELKPYFDKYNLEIYNCNPDSNLKVFDFIDYDDAIALASINMPKDLQNERTQGLYDRLAKEKAKEKAGKTKENSSIDFEAEAARLFGI